MNALTLLTTAKQGKLFYFTLPMIGLLLVSSLQTAIAQTGSKVHGTVQTDQGNPLSNVSVIVKETNTGTTTDSAGQFTISAQKGQTLIFSMTGYATKEWQLRNESDAVQLTLMASAASLDDVVVIGYGTRKKATLTGAVASVTGKEVVTTKNENVQNMLTGKIAGLRVVQNSSEPGSFDNSFEIRGLGTPLVVIDGVPRNNITRLNPADIESISVLKDASAAIYGIRAANGVVLITTKKGKKGKVSLNYNGAYGLQFPSRLPKPVGIFDYMTLVNEQRMHNMNTPLYTEADFEAYRNGTKVAANWQDAIIRNSAPFTQHDISASGGTDNTTYFVSLGYMSQDAIFKSDDVSYKRYNLRSNLSTKVAKGLTFDVNMSGILDQKDQPYISPWYVFRSLWYQPPVQNIYANNNPAYYNNVPSNLNGLAHSRSDVNGYINQKKKWFQSSVSLNYEVPAVKGLSLKGLYSYDFNDNNNKTYMKAYNLYTYNASTDTYAPVPQQTPATIRREYFEFPSSLLQASVNYNKQFSGHNINALLLYERSNRSADNIFAQRELALPVDQLMSGNSTNQQGNMSSSNTNLFKFINASYVGRLAYDYEGKYFAEFTFREDGSSRFAVNHQWGFFPAGFVAWRLSEEQFFKNTDALRFISNFKLRGSYGLTGDEDASTYQFITGYNYPAGGSATGTPAGSVFDGTFVSAVQSKGLANPAISWFTAKMLNIGVDAQAWKGLLGVTFDFFRRERSGLTATQALTLPDVVGVGLPQENLNGDRTEGFEFELSHENRIGALNYSVKGVFGYARTMNTTRVAARAGNSYINWANNPVAPNTANSLYTANRWNNIYWGYGSEGQYQSYADIVNSPVYVGRNTIVGDYIYEDWNGDGQINTLDNQPISVQGLPCITYGFTIGATYKGIDLSMTWNGAGKVYVSYFEQLNTPLWAGGGALEQFLDRWHPVDPKADPYDPNTEWVPGHYAYTGTVPFTNTLANASSAAYLRLKTVELGYSLPAKWLNKAGLKGLRVYANGYNPVTFTKLRYLDPEHPSSQFGYLYPLDIKLTFGLNLQL